VRKADNLPPSCVVTKSGNLNFLKPSGPQAKWLRCCATNRKVDGSILAGVSGIFHYGPGVDSDSNRSARIISWG